jgi:hypothetical protein
LKGEIENLFQNALKQLDWKVKRCFPLGNLALYGKDILAATQKST